MGEDEGVKRSARWKWKRRKRKKREVRTGERDKKSENEWWGRVLGGGHVWSLRKLFFFFHCC